MKNNRTFIVACIAVAFVALFLRYQYANQIFTSKGFIASNTDSYYRLHRIQQMVNQPGMLNFQYPLEDTQLNYPASQKVAWPLGLDLIFAVPMKWLGVHDDISIALFSFLFIPLLILPLMILVFRLLNQEMGNHYSLIGSLFVGITPSLIGSTMIGNIDHHALGALFILFGYYLMQRLKSRKSKNTMIGMTIVFGIAPSIDPHAWVVAIFACASLLFEADETYLKRIARSFLGAAVISILLLACTDRFLQGYVSISGFSWWSPIIYTKICIAALVIQNKRNPKVWGALAGLFVVSFVFFGKIMLHELQSGFQWLFASGTIGQTKESLSIYRYSFFQWKDFWFIFGALPIMGWFLYRTQHRALVLFALFPILLTLFQIRFIVMAIPFAIMLWIFFIHQIANDSALYGKRKMLWLAASLIITLLMYPNLNFANLRTKDYVHEYFVPVRDASRFLKKYTEEHQAINEDEFKPAVTAAWDFGHWILYFSGLPVVAHPFQGETADQVNQLMLSEDEQVFVDYQKQHPARFLMIEQSIPRFYSLFEFVGKSPYEYYEKNSDRIIEKQKISKVFFHRYLYDLGAGMDYFPDHWRLLYVSPIAAPDLKKMPALKVFEHVPGVVIRYQTEKPNITLQIRLKVRDLIYQLEKKPKKVDANTLEWTIPYGQIDMGNVFCDGNFVILDSQHKMVKKLPTVSNEQVLRGDTITVQ